MRSPTNEAVLLARCQTIEGFSFAQLAHHLGLLIPQNSLQRKGWIGQAVELALGATARNRCAPDFMTLGIELKTLPVNPSGRSAESTFITSIPLLTIHQQTWRTSQCFAKLRRVLWVPVEDCPNIAFSHRRIGRAFLWSPSQAQERILENDWSELSFMIGAGQLNELDASMGECLQVRPKAANAKSLCYGFDEVGNKIQTLPRGFYLRARFTATLLDSN